MAVARPNYEAQSVEFACLEMAEWKQKQIVDKVCEWIDDNIWDYIDTSFIGDTTTLKEVKVPKMLEDLRKNMEE